MKNLSDLSAELKGIMYLLDSFAFQFDEGSQRINDGCMATALWGISNHIERITDDIETIEEKL